ERRAPPLAREEHAQAPFPPAQCDSDVAVEQAARGIVAGNQDRSAGEQSGPRIRIEARPQVELEEAVDLIAAPGTFAHQRQQAKTVDQGEKLLETPLRITIDLVRNLDGVDQLGQRGAVQPGAKIRLLPPLRQKTA